MTKKETWFPIEYQGEKYPSYEGSTLGKIAKIENGKRTLINFDANIRRHLTIKNENGSTRPALARILYCSFHKVVIPKNMVVDHKDNDWLNDRVDNFQLLTNGQNIAKYHAWQRSLDKINPFRDWIKPKGAILRENDLYNRRVINLGLYPTQKQADAASSISKVIIDSYDVKNNDKIERAIIKVIAAYRKSIHIPPVKRYSLSSTKKENVFS